MSKIVSLRLDESLIDRVDEWAAAHEVSRTEAISRLVQSGMGSSAAGSEPVTNSLSPEAKAQRQAKKLQRKQQRAEDCAAALPAEMPEAMKRAMVTPPLVPHSPQCPCMRCRVQKEAKPLPQASLAQLPTMAEARRLKE